MKTISTPCAEILETLSLMIPTRRLCASLKYAAVMLSLLALASSSGFAGSVAPPYEIGTWQGFRLAAITYAFDGPWSSQFSIAVPMFNAAGLKMTIFTVTQGGLFLGWPPLQSAAANGHEIGSLTVDHTDLSTLTPAQQTNELANSKTAIEANIPGQKCISLAYPYCVVANLPAVRTYYSGGRTCSGQIVPSTPADMLQISSFVCGSASGIQTVPDFVSRAYSAVSQNGWCVYLLHSIDGADGGYSPISSTVLQGTLDYFNAHQDQYWVGTFGQVVRYIKERNDASVVEVSSGESLITVQVTGTLDSSIFNYPITIRRPLPAGWNGVTVKQNNTDLGAKIFTVNSTNYIMFDAVPNGGDVTITRTPFQLIVPSTATEADGTIVGQILWETTAPTNDAVISLSSSDTSEVTVPSSVTIPAGQTNAVFDVTIVDDALLDGDQVVTITASTVDFSGVQTSIIVHDNDTSALTVTLPASASEGDGTVAGAGRVSVPTPVSANITVSLASGNTSRLTVPPTTVIPNGSTSAVFNLAFVDNDVIEAPQNVSVSAHVPNWTDGSASMTILENDPFPVHFAWSEIPSPQLIGEPFRVTLTAQDATGNTLKFALPVAFDALASGAAAGTNALLNSPIPEQSGADPVEYVLGYSFTPNTNLVVTHVRHYFGDKVSLWTDSGWRIASQNVTSVPGVWTDTALAKPILLLAGATCRLTVHLIENGEYYSSVSLPGTFAHGTINQGWWDYGDVFPTQLDEPTCYFVDLRYSTDVAPVGVIPASSGNFTNGLWSGNVAVLQPGANVTLLASAGTGDFGQSLPFEVLGTPKLAVARAGNSVVLSWPAGLGFVLQQASAFPDWTAVPDVPTVAGDRCYVTNSMTATNTYYRLRKQ